MSQNSKTLTLVRDQETKDVHGIFEKYANATEYAIGFYSKTGNEKPVELHTVEIEESLNEFFDSHFTEEKRGYFGTDIDELRRLAGLG